MPPSEPRHIDWGSSEVDEGALTVELTGRIGKGWARAFQSVLVLLEPGQDQWGEVTLTKRRIHVAAIRRGSEPELRHFLESVVLQANSAFDPDALSHEPEGRESSDGQALADREMTMTFRSFAD
jgi:hypothetical protein